MHQQRPLPVRANAGDLVEGRSRQALRPLRTMRADSETVRFVAKALQVEQQRRVRLQGNLAAARKMEDLAALATVMRALCNTDDRDVVDPGIFQHLADR